MDALLKDQSSETHKPAMESVSLLGHPNARFAFTDSKACSSRRNEIVGSARLSLEAEPAWRAKI